MIRHDEESTPVDELFSLQEPVSTDPAEPATRTDKFQEQLESSQRLIEYYNEVVAEIRASLERAEAEVG
jgi:hypothetical protein